MRITIEYSIIQILVDRLQENKLVDPRSKPNIKALCWIKTNKTQAGGFPNRENALSLLGNCHCSLPVVLGLVTHFRITLLGIWGGSPFNDRTSVRIVEVTMWTISFYFESLVELQGTQTNLSVQHIPSQLNNNCSTNGRRVSINIQATKDFLLLEDGKF